MWLHVTMHVVLHTPGVCMLQCMLLYTHQVWLVVTIHVVLHIASVTGCYNACLLHTPGVTARYNACYVTHVRCDCARYNACYLTYTRCVCTYKAWLHVTMHVTLHTPRMTEHVTTHMVLCYAYWRYRPPSCNKLQLSTIIKLEQWVLFCSTASLIWTYVCYHLDCTLIIH